MSTEFHLFTKEAWLVLRKGWRSKRQRYLWTMEISSLSAFHIPPDSAPQSQLKLTLNMWKIWKVGEQGTFRRRPGYKSVGDTSAVLQKKKNMAAVEDVTVGLPSLQFEAALTQEEKYLYFFTIIQTLLQVVVDICAISVSGSCCICADEATLWQRLLVHRRKWFV